MPVTVEESRLPSRGDVLRDVEVIVGFGRRPPGSAADAKVTSWVLQRFQEIGLDQCGVEAAPIMAWSSTDASVTVWDPADPDSLQRFAGFALPYTEPAHNLEADLARPASPELVGRIVVERQEFTRLAQSEVRELATAVFDPDGEFDRLIQLIPFGSRLNQVLDPFVEAGAAGFIGLLDDLPWESQGYYVPYDAVERPISGLWLAPSKSRHFAEVVQQGCTRARLQISCKGWNEDSHNVLGWLPGATDEVVIIGSHHDAPFASAVEDASGVALVLAQAAYWAALPRERRPHTLLFLVTAAHMAGGAGTSAFIAAHPDIIDRTVLAVHLEHAAAEVRGNGVELETTGDPEPRWWFVSRDPQLEAAVLAAIVAEDLRRSHLLPPDAFFAHPPTDGGFMHLEGVPLLNFISSPPYLFDPADTLDKVHLPSLLPITRAVVRVIASLRGRTAADLRRGVGKQKEVLQ